jgi:hypothetical protein
MEEPDAYMKVPVKAPLITFCCSCKTNVTSIINGMCSEILKSELG